MKLSELMAAGDFESLDLDYKLRLDKNDPASWAKSIVAFSNGGGGYLAIGSDNSGNVAGIPYFSYDKATKTPRRETAP